MSMETTDNKRCFAFVPLSQEDERMLQRVFQQMVENIDDAKVRNLVSKYMKDFHDAEDYINDHMLIFKWYGAGQQAVEKVRQFLDAFHQEYLAVVNGQKEGILERMIAVDYPFLTDDERAFVMSFLQTEGRYPVLYIASRYLLCSSKSKIQIYAKANGITGEHQHLGQIGSEYGLTRERVRQLSLMDITKEEDAGQVWNESHWHPLGFYHQPVLTEQIVGWKEIQQKEHLDHLDFYAALAIIRQIVPLNIVALRADGRRANARHSADTPWQTPDVLFAYDSRLENFSFEVALANVGHEVCLQRIVDSRMSLSELVAQHFTEQHGEEEKEAVVNIMRVVLPLFPGVETENDDIIFRPNRTNYMEEIYQILQRKGQAMTVDDIYQEFLQKHPDDHHTNSSFIRNYMLRDDRFEAVGSKSTYQLREWERFSGPLGDLAVHLLQDSEQPLNVDTLCRLMMEQRQNTTKNSCNTSVHIAVNACRLMFYIDTEAHEESDPDRTDAEVSRHFVGLFDRKYPKRFWASPLTVEGTIRSMKRFLKENGRWPFASRKTGIEPTLYYALRKYAQKRCVTDEELTRYQLGMSGINPIDYPANERELQFKNRSKEMMKFCEKHHCLPVSGKLQEWYQTACSQQNQLTGFRRKEFLQLMSAIAASRRKWELPLFPVSSGQHTVTQLTFDFKD
jgi:hypothetical protein